MTRPRRASRASLALVDELTGLLIVPSGVTGWRSLALVDELTGATSSGSCPALTSICWPWSTCSANSKESSPRPSMRPTSWGSARNRRARTVVEALEAPALVPPLLPLRALDAVLCAHRPARGVNWIGRSSSPGPPTIRTLGADGRSPLPLRPRSNVIAALKAMAEV